MKKIWLILLVLSVAWVLPKKTEAQQNPNCFTTPTKTQTTCTVSTAAGITTASGGESVFTDAGVDTLNLTLTGLTNLLIKVSFRAIKATGTVAGTARLYGSMYGTTTTWHAIGDTATNTNAAINEHTWNITGNDLGWKFLRILRDGGTTMTGTQSAKAFCIKQNQ